MITPVLIPTPEDAAPYTVPVADCELSGWITATVGHRPMCYPTSSAITILTPAPGPAHRVNFCASDLLADLGSPMDHLIHGTALILGESAGTWTTAPPLAFSLINNLHPHYTAHPPAH